MVRVFEGPEPMARAVARAVAETAAASIRARGWFRLGVSGGETPERLYRLLASPSFQRHIDWMHAVLCFADERAVPPDHPDSNFRLVQETLIGPSGIPAENVRRMRGEDPDLERAALEYESELVEPLDLVLLGIGADGHTASIFPGSPVTDERERRVVVVTDSPKPPPKRLTITPRTLEEARGVAVLASGVAKAWAVAAALEGEVTSFALPSRWLRERDWYLDRAAASMLARAAR